MRLLLSGILAFSLMMGASSAFASTKKSGGSHASSSRSHSSSTKRSSSGKTRTHRSTTGSHRSGATHRSKTNNPASNVPSNPN